MPPGVEHFLNRLQATCGHATEQLPACPDSDAHNVESGQCLDSRGVDAVDEHATFREVELNVELAQEAETDKAVDAEAVGQVEDVHAKIRDPEPQSPESRYAQQISLLPATAVRTVAICSPCRGL